MIALIDAGEPDHDRCRNARQRPELPLVTTWPAFTDGIHLLGQAAGWAAEAALWKMVQRNVLTLAELDRELMLRWVQLMERYRDHPMDLADAPTGRARRSTRPQDDLHPRRRFRLLPAEQLVLPRRRADELHAVGPRAAPAFEA